MSTASTLRAPETEIYSNDKRPGDTGDQGSVRGEVRRYIIESILLGTTANLDDSASLLDAGILDSTGTMELVAFLETQFGVAVSDEDISSDNFDSIDRICRFVERSRQANVSRSANAA